MFLADNVRRLQRLRDNDPTWTVLHYNDLSTGAIVALCEALKSNTVLTELDVDSCFSDAAGMALGDALKSNGHLRQLATPLRQYGSVPAVA